MTAWFLLAPVFLVFTLGAWASYSDKWRDSVWFFPTVAGTGFVCSVLWYLASRALACKELIFTYSLVWDSLMMVAYYVLPLLVMGVRPGPGVMLGGALIVSGMLVIKLGG